MSRTGDKKERDLTRIKDDPRSIHSSKMLYDGLARLMRDQAFNDITVTDLVKEAHVGRATFYRNFDTIEDVLRFRCDQICERYVAYYIEYRRHHDTTALIPRLKPMLRYFDKYSDIIELLLQANQLDMLAAALRHQFEQFRPRLAMVEEEYVDYILTIRIGVVTSILAHWVKTGKQQSPDELADRLGKMIENAVTHDQLF